MKHYIFSSLAVLLGMSFGAELAFSQTNSLFPNNTAAQTGGGTGGNTTVAGAPGTAQLGQLSNNAVQGGFVGRNDNAGRFVGNTNAAQQTGGTNRNLGGGRGGGGRGGAGGGGRGGQNNGFGGGGVQRPLIRPVHRIAFNFSPSTRATISTNLQSQFRRITRTNSLRGMAGVNVNIGNQNRVTITGLVGSESDKKLAAALARLEPGVRGVINQLVVRQ